MQFTELLDTIFQNNLLLSATFSSPFQKDQSISKITIRPIELKKSLFYQISELKEQQVLHSNIKESECRELIENTLIKEYKQGIFHTSQHDFHILCNQKGKITILKKPPTKKGLPISHNRQKKYILEEGSPIPFLIQIGLMNEKGKVLAQKMSKFKQINRFLEIVDDTLSNLTLKKIHVIDFGCGKAYLTFALYHFLKEVKKLDVTMVGIDLKLDVISNCQKIALQLHCEGLKFVHGDIDQYETKNQVDLVVALHACDTATDKALEQAVRWKAKAILAAPCCQNEVYRQVKSEPLNGLLQYGIIKEKFSALATDAARALFLEIVGYETQILEFIDPEDTPKNILIKAILGNSEAKRNQARTQYAHLKALLNISPSCEKLVYYP